MIRTLITEASPTAGEIMKRILEADPEIEVVGLAKNGRECIEQVKRLKPNVITMGINMPVMDGLEATRYIMENMPTSILVVSTLVKSDVDITFKALKAGALDVIGKPKIEKEINFNKIREELIQKVKTVARVRPFKKFNRSPVGAFISKSFESGITISKNSDNESDKKRTGILAIGASTGGPPVLHYILKRIPPEFPFPIVIAQHIARGFIEGLLEWLQKDCYLNVKIGKNNEYIKKGTVYLAPDKYHLGVTNGRKILLSDDPPISGHRPSVDFLMESVSSVCKNHCMGIILTGMGRDGAQGMLTIKKSGGYTVSQDEKSSAIFGMPKAAIQTGAAMKVCPMNQIPSEIIKWVTG